MTGILTGGLTPAKLTIRAFRLREMPAAEEVGLIEAMYNPETIELYWSVNYYSDQYINGFPQSNRYQQLQPGTLRIDLLFDATLPENRSTTIDAQLSHLRSLCAAVDPATREPRFLRISWGKMAWSGRGYFAGRVTYLSVRYTMFDHDGAPLRASASLTITADESLSLQRAEADIKAPPVKIKTAQVLDTLPLIAAQSGTLAPGAKADYLDLAYANGLDNLRALSPGMSVAVSRGMDGS